MAEDFIKLQGRGPNAEKMEQQQRSERRFIVAQNKKLGFIDETGKLVLPCIYDNGFIFENGVAVVQFNGKWGVIDKQGNEKIPFKYDDHSSRTENVFVFKLNEKYGLVDKNDKIIIPFEYSNMYFDCDYVYLTQNDKHGIFDMLGNEIIPIIYDDAIVFLDLLFFYVKLNNKWGFYNLQGKPLTDIIYDDIEYGEPCDKLQTRIKFLGIKKYEKWGFIKKGGAILEPKYDRIVIPGFFQEDEKFAVGYLNGTRYLIYEDYRTTYEDGKPVVNTANSGNAGHGNKTGCFGIFAILCVVFVAVIVSSIWIII